MAFPNVVHGSEGDQYLHTTIKGMTYGQKMELEDGRIFRHFLNGTSDLVSGFMSQAMLADAALDDGAVQAAAAVGATTVSLTNSTTTLAANELENGYVLFYTSGTPSTLLGCYSIDGNEVEATGSTTYEIYLVGDDGLFVAVAATDKYSVIHNLYYKTVVWVNNAAPTARPAGASVRIVLASYYGFLQTRGICNLLNDDQANMDPGDTVVGGAAGSADDGYMVDAEAGAGLDDGDVEPIGVCCNIATTDDGMFVYLKIE